MTGPPGHVPAGGPESWYARAIPGLAVFTSNFLNYAYTDLDVPAPDAV